MAPAAFQDWRQDGSAHVVRECWGPCRSLPGSPIDSGITIPATRLRALLAVLLWRANQPVPVDELAELVWDGAPPERGAGGDPRPCHAAAAAAGQAGRGADRDARSRLPDRDLRRRAGRVTVRGADPAGGHGGPRQPWARPRGPRRRRWACGAARRWPMSPRSCCGIEWVPHLDQLHLQALEWRIEADLHEGRHEELIPELRDLTARHPLREHFHGQLMLRPLPVRAAGGGAGRLPARPRRPGRGARGRARARAAGPAPADARGRPGPGHHRRRREPAERRAAAGHVPRELPPTVPDFTGRPAELAALTGLLDQPGQRTERDGRDLGDRRDRRGRQDRAGGALGAPGRPGGSPTGSCT